MRLIDVVLYAIGEVGISIGQPLFRVAVPFVERVVSLPLVAAVSLCAAMFWSGCITC
jgi:hypothetical protein